MLERKWDADPEAKISVNLRLSASNFFTISLITTVSPVFLCVFCGSNGFLQWTQRLSDKKVPGTSEVPGTFQEQFPMRLRAPRGTKSGRCFPDPAPQSPIFRPVYG